MSTILRALRKVQDQRGPRSTGPEHYDPRASWLHRRRRFSLLGVLLPVALIAGGIGGVLALVPEGTTRLLARWTAQPEEAPAEVATATPPSPEAPAVRLPRTPAPPDAARPSAPRAPEAPSAAPRVRRSAPPPATRQVAPEAPAPHAAAPADEAPEPAPSRGLAAAPPAPAPHEAPDQPAAPAPTARADPQPAPAPLPTPAPALTAPPRPEGEAATATPAPRAERKQVAQASPKSPPRSATRSLERRKAAPPKPEPSEAPDADTDERPSGDFPRLVIRSVRWHPDPARREARIELEQAGPIDAREGDIVAGVMVRRIDPSAVEVQVGSSRAVVSVGR